MSSLNKKYLNRSTFAILVSLHLTGCLSGTSETAFNRAGQMDALSAKADGVSTVVIGGPVEPPVPPAPPAQPSAAPPVAPSVAPSVMPSVEPSNPPEPEVSPGPVPSPPPVAVCDPSDPANLITERVHGVLGRIHVALNTTEKGFKQASKYVQNIAPLSDHLILSSIAQREMRFDQGFMDGSGNPLVLVSPGGVTSRLVEYFGLHLQSDISLPDEMPEGFYQFAVLSDDGASVKLGANGAGQVLIGNDGDHPTRMSCGPTSMVNASQRGHYAMLNLQHGDRLPIEVQYYQGPKYHISLMLVWRYLGVDAPTLSIIKESDCGKAVSPGYFWNSANGQETGFAALKSRGWKNVPAAAFSFKKEVNACDLVTLGGGAVNVP